MLVFILIFRDYLIIWKYEAVFKNICDGGLICSSVKISNLKYSSIKGNFPLCSDSIEYLVLKLDYRLR